MPNKVNAEWIVGDYISPAVFLNFAISQKPIDKVGNKVYSVFNTENLLTK